MLDLFEWLAIFAIGAAVLCSEPLIDWLVP